MLFFVSFNLSENKAVFKNVSFLLTWVCLRYDQIIFIYSNLLLPGETEFCYFDRSPDGAWHKCKHYIELPYTMIRVVGSLLLKFGESLNKLVWTCTRPKVLVSVIHQCRQYYLARALRTQHVRRISAGPLRWSPSVRLITQFSQFYGSRSPLPNVFFCDFCAFLDKCGKANILSLSTGAGVIITHGQPKLP